MRISDWSSDVCSSDLTRLGDERFGQRVFADLVEARGQPQHLGLVEPANADRLVERGPALGERAGLVHDPGVDPAAVFDQIGRASCRERVCQYVSISVVAVSLQKKNKQ